MRILLVSVAFALAAPAFANEPAAAPAAETKKAAAYSVETTPIGDLLDNPAAKAVLMKHLPSLADNPQIDMARTFSLRAVQQFAPDQLTDEVLAKVEADLKALAATA